MTAACASRQTCTTTQYEDLQVTVPGTGGGIIVDNVGKVDGWGLETTVEWVASDNIDLYLAARTATAKSKRPKRCATAARSATGSRCRRCRNIRAPAIVNLRISPRATATSSSAPNCTASRRTYGGLQQLSEAVNDAYVDVTLRGGFPRGGGLVGDRAMSRT